MRGLSVDHIHCVLLNAAHYRSARHEPLFLTCSPSATLSSLSIVYRTRGVSGAGRLTQILAMLEAHSSAAARIAGEAT